MPTLTYQGNYGSVKYLNTPQTTSLSLVGTMPEGPILVSSAKAIIYVDTMARPYTYEFHVEIDDGYTGDLTYRFAHTDEVYYVNVPLDVTALDPEFPIKSISTITVVDNGAHSDRVRIRGRVQVVIQYVEVMPPTTPTNIRINGATAINLEAAKTATLTWTAGALGSYDTNLAYKIKRYDVENDSWDELATTTDLAYTLTAPYTDSKSYYYYVSSYTDNYDNLSEGFASIFTFIQLTVPTILGGGENPVYNPRPMFLVTLGDGPLEEYLTLIADGWTPSRRGYPGDKIYLKRNRSYSAATSDSITITETDERMRSVQDTLAVNYAPPDYTTSEIIAGTTIVNAADITELQTILNDIRTAYGMTEFTFTPCIAGVTSLTLWVTHITEIQNCIIEIRNFVNAWDTASPTYAIILPSMIMSTGPSAAVMNQLRTIVTML